MPTLICYDISNNTLRQKMAKAIIAAGLDRINKSVYLGTIKDSSLTLLENNLSRFLALKGEPQDSLIIIPVQAHQIQLMRVYGNNELDKEELTGTKATLMMQDETTTELSEKQILEDLENDSRSAPNSEEN